MSTRKFDDALTKLAKMFDPRQALSLDAKDAGAVAPGLKSLCEKLPSGKIKLSDTTTEMDPDGLKWTVTGTPSALAWPIPGFKLLKFELNHAKVTFTVEDGGKTKGEENDPTFELVLSTLTHIDDVHLPVSLTLFGEDEQTVVVGDADQPFHIDPIALSRATEFDGYSEELNSLSEFFDVSGCPLFSFTAVILFSTGRISTVAIEVSLVLGGVKMRLWIRGGRNSDGEFDRKTFEVAGSIGKAEGEYQLGQVISGLAGIKVWPAALDPKFRSLRLSRLLPTTPLYKNEPHRVVLQSPEDSAVPEFLITLSLPEFGERVVTVRIGCPALEAVAIPLFEGQFSIRFEPLFVVFTTRTIKFPALANLCALDSFPSLANMGTTEERAREMIFGAGVHCVGVVTVPNALKMAIHFPIRATQEALPLDLDDLPEPEEATPVPVQTQPKGLTIRSLGLKYEYSRINVMVDCAIAVMGAIIEPIGLRIGLAVKQPDTGNRVDIGLDGGQFLYKGSSLTIGGGLFRDTSKPGPPDWTGIGTLKVGETFALTAAFLFRDGDDKQLFLFAYIHRQLGGPAWCYITGLAAGFGYNRSFIVPKVEDVNKFPLIAIANKLSRAKPDAIPKKKDGKPDVDGILKSFGKAIPPSPSGNYFATAGLTFTSCGIMNSTVLVTLAWGPRTEFSILGSAVIDYPKAEPVSHVELTVVGSVNTGTGLIALDLLLGPNSYILDKACRLTGGFSIRAWFSGEHAEDFVISLGGYHPAYLKPKHYPLVPRLGFFWKKSNALRFTGFCYFAITPKNFQLGGGLDAVYDLDPLRAWFHVELHILIGWAPFSYILGMRVDVGVSFRLDLLFCSTTLSLEISADLLLWGNPFSGTAHIRLWFVSFSFDFGAPAGKEKPSLPWADFVDTFVTPPTPKEKLKEKKDLVLAEPEPKALPLDLVAVSGMQPATPTVKVRLGTHQGRPIDWLTDPQQFEMNIATTIPAEAAQFNRDAETRLGSSIYARPVKGSPRIDPTLKVRLTRLDLPAPAAADQLFPIQWTAKIGKVPSALWAQATTGDDLTGGNETIPGITHLSLRPKVEQPDQSIAINADVLLFSTIPGGNQTWHTVKIPGATFTWERDNPYKTIDQPPARNTRATMLASLEKLGLAPAGAEQKINVSNVKEAEPCFMVDPILCLLGTAETVD